MCSQLSLITGDDALACLTCSFLLVWCERAMVKDGHLPPVALTFDLLKICGHGVHSRIYMRLPNIFEMPLVVLEPKRTTH